jgi:GntR family transcriptional regulator, arabinose operon transcriptional repressor
MTSIDPHSPIPLYHQIEQAIIQLILDQHLAPGARLPSETLLAQQFGVAALTVRRGLERLERDGVILRRRGSGTFVGLRMPVRPPEGPGRIGFLLHDPTSPLLLALMHSLESALRETGLQTLVLFGGFSDRLECERIRDVVAAGALGLVIWSQCGPLALAEISRLHARSFPVVLVDRCPPDLEVDCVLVEDAAGARAAAEHLLDFGHRRIAYVYGPETLEMFTTAARLKALREAAFRRGLPPEAISEHFHARMVAQENLDATLAFARELLERPAPPTAIFCVNDALAQAMAVCLARLDVAVPAQISLTGFDGLQYLTSGMRLTTVRRNAALMGREAVRLIKLRIQDPTQPVQRIILPVDFSPGETTGPAPLSLAGGSHE